MSADFESVRKVAGAKPDSYKTELFKDCARSSLVTVASALSLFLGGAVLDAAIGGIIEAKAGLDLARIVREGAPFRKQIAMLENVEAGSVVVVGLSALLGLVGAVGTFDACSNYANEK